MASVNIEYEIDVTKGGLTSKMKMEASVPEADLEFFVEKYGAKVKGGMRKAAPKKEEPKKESSSKKEFKKSTK